MIVIVDSSEFYKETGIILIIYINRYIYTGVGKENDQDSLSDQL